MNTPNKIGKFLKDKLSQIFTLDSKQNSDLEKSSEWSNKDETIILKRCDYECLKNELLDQTQIIKRLKVRDLENKSLISEYEHSFVSLGLNNKGTISTSKEKMEQEIEKLRSNESRLKTHIKALKRELVFLSEEKENQEACQLKALEDMKSMNEGLQNNIKKYKLRIQELMFENEELKMSITKSSEELVELGVVCHELLKDFI